MLHEYKFVLFAWGVYTAPPQAGCSSWYKLISNAFFTQSNIVGSPTNRHNGSLGGGLHADAEIGGFRDNVCDDCTHLIPSNPLVPRHFYYTKHKTSSPDICNKYSYMFSFSTP